MPVTRLCKALSNETVIARTNKVVSNYSYFLLFDNTSVGANDVSMIQMADVGVGICGQEGRQAVMASDFAMGQFRFLKRLLLVHGHWNYQRLAYLVLYNFYRNAVFVLMLFWYDYFHRVGLIFFKIISGRHVNLYILLHKISRNL